jgi:hypothetical protein
MAGTLMLLLLITLITLLFYLVIPGFGAVFTIQRWRNFRKKLLKISMYPLVEYASIAQAGKGKTAYYRFFGRIEAIRGKNRIWITNGKISLEADLSNISLYFLPSWSFNPADEITSDEMLHDDFPISTKWKRIFSLPEGTRVFVGGTVVSEDGHGVFVSLQKDPILVVIYDGDEHTILKRAIWCGRQKNEYWNQLTPISILTGFFSLVLCSYLLLRNPVFRFEALLSVNLSLLPIAIFLPPGVLLFFLYRLFWKRSRMSRRERDMLLLPLRFFENKGLNPDIPYKMTILPDSSSYIMIRKSAIGENNFLLDGDPIVEGISIKKKAGYADDDSYVFGAFMYGQDRTKGGGFSGRISKPSDPMAELVEIKGNPDELSSVCAKRARISAFFAVLFILTDIVVNFVIIFLLLRYFVR